MCNRSLEPRQVNREEKHYGQQITDALDRNGDKRSRRSNSTVAHRKYCRSHYFTTAPQKKYCTEPDDGCSESIAQVCFCERAEKRAPTSGAQQIAEANGK